MNELEASRGLVDKLKSEKESIKNELEKSERLRLETSMLCSALSGRLEELAIFLNSLLEHKTVLGFLGLAQNRRLREIINSSLDMSRSFNMSLMANPEQSLAQLTNITALLNGSVFQELSLAEDGALDEETHRIDDLNPLLHKGDCNKESYFEKLSDSEVEDDRMKLAEDQEAHLSIVPDHISFTYESHLYQKISGSRTIQQPNDDDCNKESGVERLSESEVEEEGKQLELVLTPKSTSATIKAQQSEGHSESEAWSEPDRAVSR